MRSLEEVNAWIDSHEGEHQNLRERLEDELRSKWKSDLDAQSRYLEGKLKAQDGQLETILGETKKQTPILEKTAKEFRANRKARRDRKLKEELFRAWIKRAIAVGIAVGGVIEFLVRVKGH